MNLLINRNFTLLWSGQGISILGDFIFSNTLVLWIVTSIAKGQPWAPLAVSGVFLAFTVPTFVIGPIAGVLVDRWNKRQTMLQMDATRAILVLLLFLARGNVPLPFIAGEQLPVFWHLGAIYSAIVLLSVCSQFFNPSRFALLGSIVDESDWGRASGLLQVTSSLATVFAPSVAALLFFRVGIQLALWLNALSFVFSFFVILLIRIRPEPASPMIPAHHNTFSREFMEGMHFSLSNRILKTLLISGALLTFGYGTLSALNIFFLTQNLGASAHLYGLLVSTSGAGTVVGALLTGLLAQRIKISRTFSLSLVAAGLGMLVYARLASFAPALAIVFSIGFLIAVANVTVTPLVLHATPQSFIGRVTSISTLTLSLAAALSIAIVGYLDSTVLRSFHTTLMGISIGPIDTIFTITGISIVASGFYALVNLRGVSLAKARPAAETEISQI